MMTNNLFVIANVKQLRTGGSFRILLPFFRTSWGVGVLNSAVFNSFHNRVDLGTILEGLRNFGGGGGGGWTPKPPGTPLFIHKQNMALSHSLWQHSLCSAVQPTLLHLAYFSTEMTARFSIQTVMFCNQSIMLQPVNSVATSQFCCNQSILL